MGEARGAMSESEVAIKWRWIQGSVCDNMGNFSVEKEVQFCDLLFADDTIIVGMKDDMDAAVNAMKQFKGRESGSNVQREESLDFNTEVEALECQVCGWVQKQM